MSAKRSATISIQYARRVLEAATARGVATGPLCEMLRLPQPPYPDPEQRISVDQFLRLWGAVMEIVRDDAFPLRVAQVTGVAELGVLGLACKTCENLDEAIRRARRFLPLATNAARWEIMPTRDGVDLALARGSSIRPELRYVDEFVLAELVWAARIMTGIDWVPRAVHFAHPAPADAMAFHAFFGVPVQFSRPSNKLAISRSSLQLPLLKADRELSVFFERHAESLLDKVTEEPLLHAVRRTIARLLGEKETTVTTVAAALATSERTLRRRLDEADTSFRKLLDDVRCERAKRELREQRRSRDEIAERLGFSDPSAFHRAFRRWTGQTPVQYVRGQSST
jgi:AraC-like DNA-binding protein